MAPPIELLVTLPFSVFDSEGLLLQRTNDQSAKIREFGKFRPEREKFAEGSKGRGNPLELLPGHLLKGPYHFSLQKTVERLRLHLLSDLLKTYAASVPQERHGVYQNRGEKSNTILLLSGLYFNRHIVLKISPLPSPKRLRAGRCPLLPAEQGKDSRRGVIPPLVCCSCRSSTGRAGGVISVSGIRGGLEGKSSKKPTCSSY